MHPIPPQRADGDGVLGHAHLRIRITPPPRQDGSAVNDQVTSADEPQWMAVCTATINNASRTGHQRPARASEAREG